MTIGCDVLAVLPESNGDEPFTDKRGQGIPAALLEQEVRQENAATKQAEENRRFEDEKVGPGKKRVHQSCTSEATRTPSFSGFGMPLRL